MRDPWVHRLSDYIDDELAAEDRGELEQHLVECGTCRTTLSDLQRVVDGANALEDHHPPRDLWAGIATRIGAETVPTVEEIGQQTASATVVSADSHPRRRIFSFTVAQLLAACLAVVVVSGGVGYLVRSQGPGGGDGQAIQTARDESTFDAGTQAPLNEQLASLEKQIAELQTTFTQYGQTLDPDVYAALEDNLYFLDEAIADWREALSTDPQNEFLSAHLASSMMRKVRLLRQASQLATSTEI